MKNKLKNGDILTLKGGEKAIVFNSWIYKNPLSAIKLENYNDDLSLKNKLIEEDNKIIEINGVKIIEKETKINWKPKEDEIYFMAWSDKNIEIVYLNDEADKHNYEMSRMFKTQEEADKEVVRLKVKRSIELEIARLNNGWKPNWKDEEQEKYYIYYNYFLNTLRYAHSYFGKNVKNSMCLKSEKLAIELIKSHKKELLIYFEVEE